MIEQYQMFLMFLGIVKDIADGFQVFFVIKILNVKSQIIFL